MKQSLVLKRVTSLIVGVGLLSMGLTAFAAPTAAPSTPSALASCADIGFSTREDFMSRGPTPADGRPWISDGDLLSPRGVVCMRNRELLAAFNPPGVPMLPDLGLDAVDVVTVEPVKIAFSTDLNDPYGRFTHGDLLTTDGAVIPNVALTAGFAINHDIGLDAIHFIGTSTNIVRFLDFARQRTRDQWLQNPGALPSSLREFKVDVWFSTRGKANASGGRIVQDGDVLSAATGTIVMRQEDLLNLPIPAGIPAHGVNFGLDALSANCAGDKGSIVFSTRISYQDTVTPTVTFSDGDLLKLGGGVMMHNSDFVNGFGPAAHDLGLDAVTFPSQRANCGVLSLQVQDYLPALLRELLR